MRWTIRRVLGTVLAGLMICPAAAADSWKGSAAASETGEITAPADGLLIRLDLEAGQRIGEGADAGSIRSEKVFSPVEGTVSAIHPEIGDTVGETVMEIAPINKYKVSCTAKEYAIRSSETMLIHYGETVYMRCTEDQSHRAVGFIRSVDALEYEIEVTGGELYVGETVNIFRSPKFTQESIIGRGTVTTQDVLQITGEGTLQDLRVSVGDRVERGQWLFSTSSSGKTDVMSETDGIVTEVAVRAGTIVAEGDILARVATSVALEITVDQEDVSRFTEGDEWHYFRGDDDHETCRNCTVSEILQNTENGTATVRLIPEEKQIPIGMTVTVTDETHP